MIFQRPQLRQVAIALLLFAWPPAAADGEAASEDLGRMVIDQDPAVLIDGVWLDEIPIYKVHQSIVTVGDEPKQHDDAWTPRHQREKELLLTRISRDTGKWGSNHARHRLLDALHGFLRYYDRQKEELNRLKGLYKHVSKAQRALLETSIRYSHRFTEADHLLEINSGLCKRIVNHAIDFYGIEQKEVDDHIRDLEQKGHKAEKVSVTQALKHVVRDWTEEGSRERNSTFGCILESLKSIVPHGEGEAAPKILVPGSGLGRLGYEIAAAFPKSKVTINEWSMYMNLVSRFVEAHPTQHSSFVHPFLDSWSHHATWKNMQRQLTFPDVDIDTASVVLVEGDFTTVFDNQAAAYDVVVTYFFIDTARNLLAYFDTIQKLLKPGGYWVNLGPLLYGSAPYVQLSLQDIVVVVEAMGFSFVETDLDVCGDLTWPERHVRTIKAVYSFDEKALTESAYKAQFWVAQKQ